MSLQDGAGGGGAVAAAPATEDVLRVLYRRLLRELSSLPRAIGLMALLTVLSGLGTIIPQNKVRAAGAWRGGVALVLGVGLACRCVGARGRWRWRILLVRTPAWQAAGLRGGG